MNELMVYEDIRDEFKLSLGSLVNDEAVEKLCQEWVGYLCETKAENSRSPSLVSIPGDAVLPEGYGSLAYALVEEDWHAAGRGDRTRRATGFLDDPRLLCGRMFQVQDILSSLINAFAKAKARELSKTLRGQASDGLDPIAQLGVEFIDSIPDLIADFKSFVAKKKVEGPEERAVAIMAFSQYETDLHDTKNEPFTAKAMAEWVRSAQENGGKGMPPRVLGSIRAVDRDKWDPTDVEVAECLNALASKGFLKPEGASGNQTLYRINV